MFAECPVFPARGLTRTRSSRTFLVHSRPPTQRPSPFSIHIRIHRSQFGRQHLHPLRLPRVPAQVPLFPHIPLQVVERKLLPLGVREQLVVPVPHLQRQTRVRIV